ncbi:hypothetical protein Hte_011987 [Hypoxylon texense]
MEKIPLELGYHVAENLPKVDLKSLRLVSKNFNSVSTKLLFNRAYASPHLEDLDVLSAISNQPTISLAVEEIVYSGVFFHSDPIGEDPGHTSERGRSYYHAHLKQDDLTMRDEEDVAIISRALARMPNVRTVTLTNHWRPLRGLLGDRDSRVRHNWFFALPQHRDREDNRFGGPFSRTYPLFAKEPSGDPLQLEGVNFDHGFNVMCRAISLAKLPVQAFVVDFLPELFAFGGPTRGLSPGTFCLSAQSLEYCCNAFRHLRRISISVQEPGLGEHELEYHILMEGCIAMILVAATELEELTVDFTMSQRLRGLTENVPLEMFLGTHTWRSLRSIRLFRKEISRDELVGLLRRHRQTLKALCLEAVTLCDGTWVEVVEETRRWLVLESVRFLHLGEREDDGSDRPVYDKETEKYMLYGESGQIYP